MKLIFFFILVAVNVCAVADELPPLRIEGVKAGYSLSEPVAISVTNLSSHVVTYGIGVLSQVNGKWEELLTNIEDREFGGKAFKLRKLPGNKSEKLTWNPKDLGKPYSVKKGVYRFYIAYKAGADEDEQFRLETSKNIGSEVGKQNRQLIFSDVFELHP